VKYHYYTKTKDYEAHLYPFGGSKTVQTLTPEQQVPPPEPLKSTQSASFAIQASVVVVAAVVVEVVTVEVDAVEVDAVVVDVVVSAPSTQMPSMQKEPVLQNPLCSSWLQSEPASRTA